VSVSPDEGVSGYYPRRMFLPSPRAPRLHHLLLATLAALVMIGGGCASREAAPAATSAVTSTAGSPASSGNTPFVYVSGYRPEILIFRLDAASGKLTPVGSADGGREPSFLAWDRGARYLFALNEVDEGKVLSFAIDPATGALTRLSEQSSAGFGPAHLSVDRGGRFVLVANYADRKPGTIGVLPIGGDGRLGPPVDSHDFGPGTMPHMILGDPGNRFVFVPVKGGAYVAQFRLDAASGQLEPNRPDRMASAPKAGPRHMDFHPSGRFAYVINEQALTISACAFDQSKGLLAELETVPTIPLDVLDRQGFSTADIHVHPSGRLLYGSNRGHDSLVIFAIDAQSGRLTLIGHERRTIAKPRNFHIDPTGTLLFVANQDSGTVSVFRINQQSGLLDPVGPPTPVGAKPSFVGVVMLPGR
jgi:6-phosphogluconolactonase